MADWKLCSSCNISVKGSNGHKWQTGSCAQVAISYPNSTSNFGRLGLVAHYIPAKECHLLKLLPLSAVFIPPAYTSKQTLMNRSETFIRLLSHQIIPL